MSNQTDTDITPSPTRSVRKGALVRVLVAAAAVGALLFVVVRLRSVEGDIVRAFSHLRWGQVPWLAAALGAEALSFLCYALVQRRLLLAGGARLTRRSMLSLAVAATGLTNLVPGGTAPASGWLVGQYRRRGVPMPVALWAVLAGGFAATVSVLALLLAGAAIAGLVGGAQVAICAAALVVGSAAAVVVAHRLPGAARRLDRFDGRGSRVVRRLAEQAEGVVEFRTRFAGGTEVLGLSLCNWALDVVVLVAAFGLLDLPIPWRAVLFAYATAQVAGSLAPVPGGIGFVEGGMIGAFALAHAGVGHAVAATVIYRVITCWAMAAVGSLTMLVVSRRRPKPAEVGTTGGASGVTKGRGAGSSAGRS